MLIETKVYLLCDYNQTEPLVVGVNTGAEGCLYEVLYVNSKKVIYTN